MRPLKKPLGLLVFLAFALNLACPLTVNPGKPGPIKIKLTASQRLNPDEKGRSLPTWIRVYQVRAASKIESAEFDDLFKRKDYLGQDLLQMDEIQIAPGQELVKTLGRDKEARYIAVVGLFRRPSGLTWRGVVELPKLSSDTEVSFFLEDYRVIQK